MNEGIHSQPFLYDITANYNRHCDKCKIEDSVFMTPRGEFVSAGVATGPAVNIKANDSRNATATPAR